jgi:hypothetical protein
MLLVLMLGSLTLPVLSASGPAAPAGSEPPQVRCSHSGKVRSVSDICSHGEIPFLTRVTLPGDRYAV